jgi:Sulfotransferase family
MTLVSHRHQFVFLKTRKTGGSYFEMLLEPFCAPSGHEVVHHTKGRVSADGIIGVRAPTSHIPHLRERGELPTSVIPTQMGESVAIEWRSHMPAKMVRRGIGVPAWRRYRRVTAVRNPFTRAVSLFFHSMMTRRIPAAQSDIGELTDSFRKFVVSPLFMSDFEITHIGERRAYQYAIRLEHRERDIDWLGDQLGLDLDASMLPHVKNLRPNREGLPVREFFDKHSVDVVRQSCRWIFDEVGYSPDIEDARF